MNELNVQKTVQTLPEELKMNVFNALNNPDYKISDCYGQQIEVQAWLSSRNEITADRGN